MLFRRLQGLFAVKILCCGGGFMIDCGVFCRDCGGFYVFFRRLQGLFAVKMRCGNGKMRCENGEMVVRLRRLVVWLRGFSCLVSL